MDIQYITKNIVKCHGYTVHNNKHVNTVTDIQYIIINMVNNHGYQYMTINTVNSHGYTVHDNKHSELSWIYSTLQ